jgi:hypothetical protein
LFSTGIRALFPTGRKNFHDSGFFLTEGVSLL